MLVIWGGQLLLRGLTHPCWPLIGVANSRHGRVNERESSGALETQENWRSSCDRFPIRITWSVPTQPHSIGYYAAGRIYTQHTHGCRYWLAYWPTAMAFWWTASPTIQKKQIRKSILLDFFENRFQVVWLSLMFGLGYNCTSRDSHVYESAFFWGGRFDRYRSPAPPDRDVDCSLLYICFRISYLWKIAENCVSFIQPRRSVWRVKCTGEQRWSLPLDDHWWLDYFLPVIACHHRAIRTRGNAEMTGNF